MTVLIVREEYATALPAMNHPNVTRAVKDIMMMVEHVQVSTEIVKRNAYIEMNLTGVIYVFMRGHFMYSNFQFCLREHNFDTEF